MGACLGNASPEDLEARKAAVRVDAQIKQSQDEDKGILKLLLLGAGESGKSTLFKQAMALYGKGLSEKEVREFIPIIVENIIVSAQTLVRIAGSDISPVPISSQNEKNKLIVESLDLINRKLSAPEADAIAVLWLDEGIQAAYANKSKFQLTDSTEYFLKRIHDVVSPTYVPSQQDILRARARTSGIVETSFVIDNNHFKMYDVGGQRNERKKWIHCFESVTAVLFVVALSEYDQLLFEDENTNRMVEAANLFDEICNSAWFRQVSIILFLNKKDLFAEKVKHVPITVCPSFVDYPGPQDDSPESAFIEAADFIKDYFLSLNKHEDNRGLYTHVTCATDTENIKVVFNAVQDIVIKEALKKSGLFQA